MAEPVKPGSPFFGLTPEQIEKLPKQNWGHDGPSTHVTLSGLAVTADGKLRKSKWLNVLTNTVDDYSDTVLTAEEAKKIIGHMLNFKNGSTASIPVVCTGPHCPWASRCVYMQIGKPPLAKQCLVEINLMKQWQLNYLEQYEIDIDNMTELTLVNELVEVELLLHRCNLSMSLDSEEAGGVVNQTIGFDNQGNPVQQRQISQYIELREKLLNRKHKLIKLMVGDRQEKYKKEAALKMRESTDPSSTMSQLKEQMESLQRELGKAVSNIIPGQVVEISGEKNDEKVPSARVKPLNPDDLPAEDDDS